MSSKKFVFDFFLSYSSKDKQIASKIARDLTERGFRVFFSEWDIHVGDSIIDKVTSGLENTQYLLVLISPNSLQSYGVNKEISLAVSKNPSLAKTRIIPVIIEKVDKDRISPFFKYAGWIDDIAWVDLSKDYEKGLSEIIALKKHPSKIAKSPDQLVDVNGLAKAVAIEVAEILKSDPKGIRKPTSNAANYPSNLVFVIMSFLPDMDPIFEGIKAAAEKNGLTAERVKDVQGDYKITDKIIELICAAKIIVADLTHEKPNVYFELGYARGIDKTLVTIARTNTKLHFDVKDWTCDFYNDSRVVEARLTTRFAFELTKK